MRFVQKQQRAFLAMVWRVAELLRGGRNPFGTEQGRFQSNYPYSF